jgi:hypothetical protein
MCEVDTTACRRHCQFIRYLVPIFMYSSTPNWSRSAHIIVAVVDVYYRNVPKLVKQFTMSFLPVSVRHMFPNSMKTPELISIANDL